MFTGIIETIGTIKEITQEDNNLHITVNSSITQELKIDQSVAHNGICLTVVNISEDSYTVTAIKETIEKTNIASWKENDAVNLERAMKLGDRLDGTLFKVTLTKLGFAKKLEKQMAVGILLLNTTQHYTTLPLKKDQSPSMALV